MWVGETPCSCFHAVMRRRRVGGFCTTSCDYRASVERGSAKSCTKVWGRDWVGEAWGEGCTGSQTLTPDVKPLVAALHGKMFLFLKHEHAVGLDIQGAAVGMLGSKWTTLPHYLCWVGSAEYLEQAYMPCVLYMRSIS